MVSLGVSSFRATRTHPSNSSHSHSLVRVNGSKQKHRLDWKCRNRCCKLDFLGNGVHHFLKEARTSLEEGIVGRRKSLDLQFSIDGKNPVVRAS